jgi:NADH-quinone oxidoreductase subunit N
VKIVLAVTTAVVLVFWLVPAPLVGTAGAAAKSLF